MVKKKFENVFTGFDTIHERDRRQTDGQTPHDSKGAIMHSIARQKPSRGRGSTRLPLVSLYTHGSLQQPRT